MMQFPNFDIEKYLPYIIISSKMLVIHKSPRKYTNKHSNIKHTLKVSNDVILMFSFICWEFHYLLVIGYLYNDDTVTWHFFTHINRLMLLQKNGTNLSTNETKVVSQDSPKFLGSPATSGSQRVNFILSERFSNGFWGLEVLLFSGFINIVFILIYEFMN